MAEKACHVVASTTHFGLTQALATMKIIISALLALTLAPAFAARSQDRPVAEVLGETVYDSQVKSSTERERSDSLRTLVISPAIRNYLEPYKSEWSLNESEIAALTDSYKAYIKCKPELGLRLMDPPFDKLFAVMIGGKAKVERFIYLNHGHGRILFQQSGAEAFDATLNLVHKLERENKFNFHDQADRDLALSYWTRTNQSSPLPDPGPDKAFQLDELLLKCS